MARALAERWLLIVGLMIVGAAAGLTMSLELEPVYTARATLLVGPSGGTGGSVATERWLAEFPAVAARAADALAAGGPALTAAEVDERTSVVTRGGGAFVILARGEDPAASARLAAFYARAYLAFVRENERRRLDDVIETLEAELRSLPEGGQASELGRRLASLRENRAQTGRGASLVGQPQVPTDPDSRDIARNVGAGAGAGLLLALSLAWGLAHFDRKVRRPEDLEELYGLPILAKVPRSPKLMDSSGDLSTFSGLGREAEAFRSLRANLRYFPRASGQTPGIGSLLVVSPLSGEGKSTIARLLAVTMAGMGDRVCLVDADLRKGDLSPSGARGARPEGLSLVLAGFDLDESLTDVPVAVDPMFGNPRVLVELLSGAAPPNPSELLESERMRWTISELEQRFDAVIIDSPAIASVSDGLALVKWVSGVLVVGALGRTTRNAGRDLSRQLNFLGARPVGLVVNRWRPAREYAYDYEHPAGAAAASRRAGGE